jgi:hypothetical protein
MDQENAPDLPGDVVTVQSLEVLAPLLRGRSDPELWEIARVIVRAIAPDLESQEAWAAELLRMKEAERAQSVMDAETLAYITERRRLEEAQKQAHALAVRQAEKRGAHKARSHFKAVGLASETTPPIHERGPVILAKLREMGHDPLNLPAFQNGKHDPTRAEVAALLLWSEVVFRKAWHRLMKSEAIRYNRPVS